jgi:GT2 family glycosyltransferase
LRDIDYPNYEVVLVDNASRDNSADRIKQNFPEITLIKNPDNLGFAEGNNMGIRYLLKKNIDHVMLLNNDTVVDRKFLTELIDGLEAYPGAGSAGPKIYYMGRPDVIWFAGGGFRKISGRTFHYGIGQKDNGQFDKVREVGFVTGCALLVKRSLIEKVGLLDPDYFFSYEDVDWSERAAKKHYKLIYVPSSRVWHKFAASAGGRFAPLYVYYRVRNKLIFARKHGRPLSEFLFNLIFFPAAFMIYSALTLNFMALPAIVRAIVDFFAGSWGKARSF